MTVLGLFKFRCLGVELILLIKDVGDDGDTRELPHEHTKKTQKCGEEIAKISTTFFVHFHLYGRARTYFWRKQH